MKKIILCLLILTSCTTIEIKGNKPYNLEKDVCIIKNEKVLIKDLLPYIKTRFELEGFNVDIKSKKDLSGCTTCIQYSGRRSWDIVPYVATSEIEMFDDDGKLFATMLYTRPPWLFDYSPFKWSSVEDKLENPITELLELALYNKHGPNYVEDFIIPVIPLENLSVEESIYYHAFNELCYKNIGETNNVIYNNSILSNPYAKWLNITYSNNKSEYIDTWAYNLHYSKGSNKFFYIKGSNFQFDCAIHVDINPESKVELKRFVRYFTKRIGKSYYRKIDEGVNTSYEYLLENGSHIILSTVYHGYRTRELIIKYKK